MTIKLFLTHREEGLDVESFGTNKTVKLPGPAIDKPNVYSFGTPYKEMHDELLQKDETLYTQNGILAMLERNMKIKEAPERFQDSPDEFDVLITCEQKCFDIVLERRKS